jgi:predicted Holliday junction resolvase-like endonuclease
MFGLLLTILFLTVFTKENRNTKLKQDFAIEEHKMQNKLLAQEVHDTIR